MRAMNITIHGLLLLLLVNIGCRKEETFDIRGTWSFRTVSEEVVIFSFSGTLEKGILIHPINKDDIGSYSVSGKEIVFDFISTCAGGTCYHFRGSFVSENSLSGTMKCTAATAPPYPSEWTLDVEGQRL